ncbi:MAG: type II secretion system protein N [Brevundimonas sp.]|uniref:type II secretion system protein N n=1 Tax=Brevundimonas sp. TaxID=1871086 RepID=UPI00260C810F|nr:type II secretion system protein N [Brevundimonas sp.]MDI6624522.1 type II secretion system protein N [Brevundimonas sp.]MDQ7812249.1 type II secretion system protein N [Brevundimonas sp.]
MIGVLRNWSTGAREALAARPDRVRAAMEATLALLLIVQLGRLVWIAVEPVDIPAAATVARPQAQPVDYAVFQRFDAFFRTGARSSLAEDTAAGSSQMRLFGLRSDGAGGGSAIIGLADGRQLSVAVGETIEPGLVLQSVGADHVVLARGASLSRLIFSELPVGAATPPPPPPVPQTVTPTPAPATASVDPAQLMAEAALRPRMQGLKVNGFTISSRGESPTLAAAGLQPGDVILAVNGQALDRPDRIAALRGQLADAASAEIRFERDGAVQTTTIRTGR